MSQSKLRRNWKCLIYPESCGCETAEELYRKLEELCIPLAISPLHDSDYKEDGELDKPHYHVLITLTAKQKYDVVLSWFKPFGVKILKESRDLRSEERYLCHLDSRTKFKYPIEDLVGLGGYTFRYLGDREDMSALQQIHDMVEELGIVYYCDLSNEILTKHPDLITTFLRYPAHFNNFCYSRERFSKKLSTSDNNTYVKYARSRILMGR